MYVDVQRTAVKSSTVCPCTMSPTCSSSTSTSCPTVYSPSVCRRPAVASSHVRRLSLSRRQLFTATKR